MSRTYRRKNYELTKNSSCDREGRKTNLHLTTHDRIIDRTQGHPYLFIYRPMTDSEANAEKLRIHGESTHSKAWSPDKRYRKYFQNRMNTYNTRQYLRWLNDSSYDPVWAHTPDSCWRVWDWY